MTLFLYLVTDHDFMVNTSLNMYKTVVRVIWQQPSVLTNTVLLVVGRAPIGSIPTYKDNAHYIFPNYGRLYHSQVAPSPGPLGMPTISWLYTELSSTPELDVTWFDWGLWNLPIDTYHMYLAPDHTYRFQLSCSYLTDAVHSATFSTGVLSHPQCPPVKYYVK